MVQTSYKSVTNQLQIVYVVEALADKMILDLTGEMRFYCCYCGINQAKKNSDVGSLRGYFCKWRPLLETFNLESFELIWLFAVISRSGSFWNCVKFRLQRLLWISGIAEKNYENEGYLWFWIYAHSSLIGLSEPNRAKTNQNTKSNPICYLNKVYMFLMLFLKFSTKITAHWTFWAHNTQENDLLDNIDV